MKNNKDKFFIMVRGDTLFSLFAKNFLKLAALGSEGGDLRLEKEIIFCESF